MNLFFYIQLLEGNCYSQLYPNFFNKNFKFIIFGII